LTNVVASNKFSLRNVSTVMYLAISPPQHTAFHESNSVSLDLASVDVENHVFEKVLMPRSGTGSWQIKI
jgi:hypothetical protein